MHALWSGLKEGEHRAGGLCPTGDEADPVREWPGKASWMRRHLRQHLKDRWQLSKVIKWWEGYSRHRYLMCEHQETRQNEV